MKTSNQQKARIEKVLKQATALGATDFGLFAALQGSPWANTAKQYPLGNAVLARTPLKGVRASGGRRPLTDFQRRVYKAVLKIPAGQTRSYKWVAQQIGRPRAARAVGQALNRNPLPFRPGRMWGIPCHRVIAADGTLGGFSSGLRLKKRLLEIESPA